MLVSDVPVSYFGIFHEKISRCLVDIENFRLGVHPPLIDEGRKSKNLQSNFLRLHTSEPFSPNLRISFRFGSPQASK